MDIPSYLVETGDVVKWKGSNGKLPEFAKMIMESGGRLPTPGWLKVELDKGEAEVIGEPTSDALDSSIDVRLIVEFYSK
jgi:ribosomal protein S4